MLPQNHNDVLFKDKHEPAYPVDINSRLRQHNGVVSQSFAKYKISQKQQQQQHQL